mmetsp:Transcript_55806/g.141289  ORF Transcript_55806/g.141289 Transcript_55806/m.141289 type:complete len:279 (-) Transcript_55806:118-954(-)
MTPEEVAAEEPQAQRQRDQGENPGGVHQCRRVEAHERDRDNDRQNDGHLLPAEFQDGQGTEEKAHAEGHGADCLHCSKLDDCTGREALGFEGRPVEECEEDDGAAVVHDALAADDRGQPRVRAELLHPGEHCDGVGGGEHRPEHHPRVPIEVLRQQVDHEDAHQQRAEEHAGECQDQRLTHHLAEHVEVCMEELREDQWRQYSKLQHRGRDAGVRCLLRDHLEGITHEVVAGAPCPEVADAQAHKKDDDRVGQVPLKRQRQGADDGPDEEPEDDQHQH